MLTSSEKSAVITFCWEKNGAISGSYKPRVNRVCWESHNSNFTRLDVIIIDNIMHVVYIVVLIFA